MNPYDIIIPPGLARALDAMPAPEHDSVVRGLAGAAVAALMPHQGLPLDLHHSVHSIPVGDREVRYRVDRAHQTLRVLSLGHPHQAPSSAEERDWENEGGHRG